MNTRDAVCVRWTLGLGEEGVDKDIDNPLRRALARLFTTGKPFSRLVQVFVEFDEGPLRWLGVFVQGKRTMFFPGFSHQFDSIEAFRGDLLDIRRGFFLDHFSLEANRTAWHVTSRNSTDHLRQAPTRNLGNGRVLWFGLSSVDRHCFKPVLRTTHIEFDSPLGDGNRRREVFQKARDGAVFPIVSFPESHADHFGTPKFFHFSAIAGPPGFDVYLGPNHAPPLGGPYVRGDVATLAGDKHCRVHRVSISPTVDLQLTMFQLAGELVAPITLTAP